MPKSVRDHKVRYLLEVASKLGIKNKIHYTNMKWKGEFLEENNFDILFDDNIIEKDYLKDCDFIDANKFLR